MVTLMRILVRVFVAVFALNTIGIAQNHRALDALVQSERDFCKAALARGVNASFVEYFADDAVIFRPGPVNGREWYRKRAPSTIRLNWEPIVADVATSGDLGYTTGPWVATDTSGNSYFGSYASLWRKQKTGEWKVILDAGIDYPKPTQNSGALRKGSADSYSGSDKDAEMARSSILAEEKKLAEFSASVGFATASMSPTVAEEAVFLRAGHEPIVGRDSLSSILRGDFTWTPVQSGASRSGDLGYTYGPYHLKSAADSTKEGYYVRIWKKRKDGAWNVVLDLLQ
jgi:ketosteroid isomerase-like protein